MEEPINADVASMMDAANERMQRVIRHPRALANGHMIVEGLKEAVDLFNRVETPMGRVSAAICTGRLVDQWVTMCSSTGAPVPNGVWLMIGKAFKGLEQVPPTFSPGRGGIAALSLSVGKAYMYVGEFRTAATHFQRAATQCASNFSGVVLSSAAFCELSTALCRVNHIDDALQAARMAVTVAQLLRPDGTTEDVLERACLAMAMAEGCAGRFNDAMSSLRLVDALLHANERARKSTRLHALQMNIVIRASHTAVDEEEHAVLVKDVEDALFHFTQLADGDVRAEQLGQELIKGIAHAWRTKTPLRPDVSPFLS
jgi:hypothetical protein